MIISGDPTALDELRARLTADDVRARPIEVDYASHSPQVEAIRQRLLDDLAAIAPRQGRIPFYSTVSAERIDTRTLDAQ